MTEYVLTPNWPAPPHIKAYTTLRTSGVSSFEQRINPIALKDLLNLPNEPIWLKQTHSTIALKALPANRGLEADASFTNEVNQVCLVLTADCLPLLIYQPQSQYVAAIHAGWRGLLNGIIDTTVKQLNLSTSDTMVWLGPAIGPKRFAVRQDVYEAFTRKSPEADNAFLHIDNDQWLANLYLLAKQQLARLGITHIYGGEYCTHTDSEKFFSYRRDGNSTGRMATLIWREM